MGEVTDKIVVVTGGSRGIGRAIAAACAREGAQTVLAASNAANLAVPKERIEKAGGPSPLTVAGDLKELKNCEKLYQTVRERFGRCDVLVNSAGATRAGAFLELEDALWLSGLSLSVF